MTDTQTTPASRLWIGTYPGDVPGAEGIWDVAIDPVTGELGVPVRLAEAQSPSYLAKHPQPEEFPPTFAQPAPPEN